MRKAKSNFSRDKINDATNYSNPKETWKLINCLLGRTNRSTYVTELLADDDTVISDPYLMSELFNDYFINIGQKLASENDQVLRQWLTRMNCTALATVHPHLDM